MKIIMTILLATFASVALSQERYVEIKQEFLSARSDLGTWEVATHQSVLDKSLSDSLKRHVLKSSEPYAIGNMNEIQTLINDEKSKLYPDLRLSLNTFVGSNPLNIFINRIDTRQGRDILRGKIDGLADSQVKLVVYNGQMSGRITYSREQKVLVIRSINGGISANYEVDTSNITYD